MELCALEMQEIVEKILDNFSTKEINKLMSLNRLWKKAGKWVKNKRVNQIEWRTIEDKNYDTSSDTEIFKSIFHEPKFVLSFSKKLLQIDGSKHFFARNNKFYSKILQKHLPQSCVSYQVVTKSIISYLNDEIHEEEHNVASLFFPNLPDIDFEIHSDIHDTTDYNLTDYEDDDAYDEISISGGSRSIKRTHEGVIISHSNPTNPTINHNKLNEYGEAQLDDEEFLTDHKGTFNSEPPTMKDKVPKLILHFSSLDDNGEVDVIKKLRRNFSCPIAGFFCNKIFQNDEIIDVLTLVLHGNDKMKVAQVVIKFEDCVAEKLNLLHEAIVSMASKPTDAVRDTAYSSKKPQNSCINNEEGVGVRLEHKSSGSEDGSLKNYKSLLGFMFSCVARGRSMYNKTNVESQLFSKTFPGVPLFGGFGDGEIGEDVLAGAQMEPNAVCIHSYTSVFVLIGVLK